MQSVGVGYFHMSVPLIPHPIQHKLSLMFFILAILIVFFSVALEPVLELTLVDQVGL